MSRVAPGHPATAAAVINDEAGRVLIVRPVEDSWWGLPGGLVEANEAPDTACEREVREELGLNVAVAALLTVAWKPARTPGKRARHAFVFATTPVQAARVEAGIRLQSEELADWRWADPPTAATLLHPHVHERLLAGQAGVRYLVQGNDVGEDAATLDRAGPTPTARRLPGSSVESPLHCDGCRCRPTCRCQCDHLALGCVGCCCDCGWEGDRPPERCVCCGRPPSRG